MLEQPIKNYMSVLTQTVTSSQSVGEADKILNENHIRHLPVTDEEGLVGIISQTDIHLVQRLEGLDSSKLAVGRAMTPLPYAVPPEEPLAEVTRVMAENGYGSAVVVDEGAVVGIFTFTDAVRVLAQTLRKVP